MVLNSVNRDEPMDIVYFRYQLLECFEVGIYMILFIR